MFEVLCTFCRLQKKRLEKMNDWLGLRKQKSVRNRERKNVNERALKEKGHVNGLEERAEMEEECQVGGMSITEMRGSQIGKGIEVGPMEEADLVPQPGMVIEDSQESSVKVLADNVDN